MVNRHNIVLIGYGKMGSALHQGWIKADFPATYSIISPSQSPRIDGLCHYYNDVQDSTFQEALKNADIVMMAVKPQKMREVCAQIKPYVSVSSLILSIAAGQTLQTFEGYFNAQQPIIRSMPNTPSAIGKGVTGYVCNNACSDTQKQLVHDLLNISGAVYELSNEDLIDPLSAISGSGPAYLFYFTEALTQAGIDAGLPVDIAADLARQTMVGAGALMEAAPDTPPSTLRENVTSPGGTTQAALNVMMNGDMQDIITKAIHAAVSRAKEL